jgi:hypothetical protein
MPRGKRHNRQSFSYNGEAAREDRIASATKEYLARFGTQREISIRKIALKYGIPWETIRGRIAGRVERKCVVEEMQRLSIFEEHILVQYCLQLYAWGWPARIHQFRRLAIDLLKEKGDTLPLGKN